MFRLPSTSLFFLLVSATASLAYLSTMVPLKPGTRSDTTSASGPSVTFPATTNTVVSASINKACMKTTKEVIQSHDTFVATFSSEKENDGRFGRRGTTSKLPGNVATIIQGSSLEEESAPCASGLVSAVLEAYNHHHNLVLRPDDVWQAILTQFSVYLTAHAEELRDRIVDFKGQKELTITAAGTLFTVDFGNLANRMVDEQIIRNIKDPMIVSWLLPAFTTTTNDDRIAASVSVMSSMKKYFKYKLELSCGIPNVTLMGTPEDWSALRTKVDGLLQFEVAGEDHIKQWHKWLASICDNLVMSSEGKADIAFWDRVASHKGGGSGPRYISGWISAFAVWAEEGHWQGVTKQDTYRSDFPVINTNDLPSGAVSVPVLVDDNGKEYNCTMFSGQFGMKLEDATVYPKTSWCIATKDLEN